MTAILRAAARQVRRRRRSFTALAVLTWLLIMPPTTVEQLVIGGAVGTLVYRVLGRRPSAPDIRSTPGRRRCPTILGFVVLLLVQIGVPSAWADIDIDPATYRGEQCRQAPTPETTGTGVTGLLDPQASLTMDGTIYGDRGYAGLFWHAYDPGCTASALGEALGATGVTLGGAFDGNGSAGDTQAGNILMKMAKLELAATTGMRTRAMDLHFFDDLDSIMTAGINALNDLLITPWLGLPLMIMGLILAMLARRGRSSESAHRVLVGLVGLGLIAFLGQYPLAAAGWADSKIVALQQQFEQGFLSRIPDSMIPVLRYCNYDYSQFDKNAAIDENGSHIVSGTACTPNTHPTLDPADKTPTPNADGTVNVYAPDYFATNFYPEVMVESLIFPYWQQGLIGSSDRSGPSYDLARQFLSGQSVTRFEANANVRRQEVGTSGATGAVWCTYADNVQVCGRTESGLVPDQIMTYTEQAYRAAIESAGEERYPWIKGAGNRLSSGATALAAVTAASPLPFASYTGVFAGRLVLRIFIFAGLIAALGVFIWPRLLRRIGNTVGAALATIVLLSVLGSLTTYLTLQLTANPALFGRIGLQGGLVILAITSVLLWLAVRPMQRIGAMLSTAVTGNPTAMSNARRTASGWMRRRMHLPQGPRLRRLGRGRGLMPGGMGGGSHQGHSGEHGDGSGWAPAPTWDDHADTPVGNRPESTAARARAVADDGHPLPGDRPEKRSVEVAANPSSSTSAALSDAVTDRWPRSDPDPDRATTILPRSDQTSDRPTTVIPRAGTATQDSDDRHTTVIGTRSSSGSAPRSALPTESGTWVVSDVGDLYRPESADARRRAPQSPVDDVETRGRIWTPPAPRRRPALTGARRPESEAADVEA